MKNLQSINNLAILLFLLLVLGCKKEPCLNRLNLPSSTKVNG